MSTWRYPPVPVSTDWSCILLHQVFLCLGEICTEKNRLNELVLMNKPLNLIFFSKSWGHILLRNTWSQLSLFLCVLIWMYHSKKMCVDVPAVLQNFTFPFLFLFPFTTSQWELFTIIECLHPWFKLPDCYAKICEEVKHIILIPC